MMLGTIRCSYRGSQVRRERRRDTDSPVRAVGAARHQTGDSEVTVTSAMLRRSESACKKQWLAPVCTLPAGGGGSPVTLSSQYLISLGCGLTLPPARLRQPRLSREGKSLFLHASSSLELTQPLQSGVTKRPQCPSVPGPSRLKTVPMWSLLANTHSSVA